jgi:hypothetical protein
VCKAAQSVVLIAEVAPLRARRAECRAKWLARTDDGSGSTSEMVAIPRYFCFARMSGHRETK